MDEKQLISEYMTDLPPKLRDLLTSEDLVQELQTIANNNRLHVDQLEILFNEVGSVIAGVAEPKDFPRNLSRALRISIDQASLITAEINRQILDPIRNELEKVYERNASLTKEPKAINQPETIDDEHPELAHITRDDLLSEIENPIPTGFRGASSGPATVSPSVNAGLIPNIPITPKPIATAPVPTTPSPTPPTTPNKLGETTISTTQTVTISTEAVSKKYTTDPYREPVE